MDTDRMLYFHIKLFFNISVFRLVSLASLFIAKLSIFRRQMALSFSSSSSAKLRKCSDCSVREKRGLEI